MWQWKAPRASFHCHALISVYNVQRRNIGRAKCIVCPTNPTVGRANALPAHYVPAPLCLRRYLPSDAEHHMLVLHGPGMQHGQTEISVDDVRCHQWLTNQIAEAPLHWRHEPTSIHQSLTPHVESLQCIHVGQQEGLCFCTLEQNRPYQWLVQVYFGADT